MWICAAMVAAAVIVVAATGNSFVLLPAFGCLAMMAMMIWMMGMGGRQDHSSDARREEK